MNPTAEFAQIILNHYFCLDHFRYELITSFLPEKGFLQ